MTYELAFKGGEKAQQGENEVSFWILFGAAAPTTSLNRLCDYGLLHAEMTGEGGEWRNYFLLR